MKKRKAANAPNEDTGVRCTPDSNAYLAAVPGHKLRPEDELVEAEAVLVCDNTRVGRRCGAEQTLHIDFKRVHTK